MLADPRARAAYAVHLLTASGVVAAFLAVAELFDDAPDERVVFAWLVVAVVIDAVDGPLARAWDVKRFAADIDGRTIDDIVDYLTFTFIPLLLVWRMGWVPFAPGFAGAAWIVPALVASLLGFANVGAKDEAAGYFRGFPSYWNIAAFYAGLASHGLGEAGQWLNGVSPAGAGGADRLAGAIHLPEPRPAPVEAAGDARGGRMAGGAPGDAARVPPGARVGGGGVAHLPGVLRTLSILLDPQRHGRVRARYP